MKLEIEVSDEQLADVICAGYEGGIGYWCKQAKFTEEPVPALAHAAPLSADAIARRYYQPLVGGSIRFRDADSRKWFTLDCAALRRGIQVIAEKYPHHLGAVFGSSDFDATTGDVLIQCSIFGEVIYG